SPSASLRAVAAFAGARIDQKLADDVASDRTFERMQAAEASGELASRYGNALMPGNSNDRESFKVRRGLVGGYSAYLSSPDQRYCEEAFTRIRYWIHLQAALSRWGLAIPDPCPRRTSAS